MTDCVFCGRIRHGLFDQSDAHAVSFPPLRPVTPGHLLVVPRVHVPDARADPDVTAHTMRLAAELAARRGQQCNLITSAGRWATQTVLHLHIHIVPRHQDDGLLLPWT
jgi:histidine triad (HIT) family protein